MKTLIKNGVSCFLLEDEDYVSIKDTHTELVDKGPLPGMIHLLDFDTSNSIVVENIVNIPEDWQQDKYLYQDGVWSVNPDWIAPSIP
jgi:hypothetical protein